MKKRIDNIILNYDFYNGVDESNDGDEVEKKVLETVKTLTDYTEVLADDNRWSVLYHLSDLRKNIIEPMEISKTDTVLEVGAGMGAVTGAIAERCKKIDCIELSARRSLANAYRNKAYSNIEIFVGNFNDIPLKTNYYDVITLVGVLEYAQSYTNTTNPYIDFLTKISHSLKKGGKIYIAIENKLGLKYFAGCCEDHLGRPFIGIEGYKSSDSVKTFSKSQLEELMEKCGFYNLYFYYPYPDYKMPTVIYSDDYLPNETFSISNNNNYDQGRISCFDEKKAYQSLIGAEELKFLANSFLVEGLKK